jgi:hypothetical protein
VCSGRVLRVANLTLAAALPYSILFRTSDEIMKSEAYKNKWDNYHKSKANSHGSLLASAPSPMKL